MAEFKVLDVPLCNVTIDDIVRGRVAARFIVPVNVDVLMKTQNDSCFIEALRRYVNSILFVPDSQVLIAAIRLIFGFKFTSRVSGSDLLPVICKRFDQAQGGIFFLGGTNGAADAAKDRINKEVNRDVVVGAYSPSWGFELIPEECKSIVKMINDSGATIVAVGVGAPKQELWMLQHAEKMPGVKTFIAVGATIDFLAGKVRRAPAWVSNAGLEWLFRLIQEPKRLAKRYLLDDLPFFWLLLKQKYGLHK